MFKLSPSGIFLAIFLMLAGASPFLQSQVRELPVIEVDPDAGPHRTLALNCSDGEILTLLTLAFRAHGAFTVVPAERAQFVLTVSFSPSAPSVAQLKIESGRPPQRLLEETVRGRDRKDAAMRAADFAVTKMVGLPGIFAGTLVFVSDRSGMPEIYLSDLFFSRLKRLTFDNAQCALPTISPDLGKMIYTSYFRGGFPDLYAVELATGKRTVYARYRGTNTGATFDPSGTQVAMVLSGSGNAEIYVVNARGRNIRRITRTDGLESDPSWSPDGTRLVFTSDEPGQPQLHVVGANGGNPRRLPTNISRYCAEPAWNPVNANQIAFTAAVAKQFQLALYDMREGKSVWLTSASGDAVEPTWLRDGRHLIFTERRGTSKRLVLLDTVSKKRSYLHESAFGNTYQADYAYGN